MFNFIVCAVILGIPAFVVWCVLASFFGYVSSRKDFFS